MGSPANPRRHPHVADTIDYLRHLGAEDVEVIAKRSALQVAWLHDGAAMSVSLSRNGTSRVHGTMARQLVRRRFREAGVEVRA